MEVSCHIANKEVMLLCSACHACGKGGGGGHYTFHMTFSSLARTHQGNIIRLFLFLKCKLEISHKGEILLNPKLCNGFVF